MACINADGSLTPIAKKVLTALVIPGSAHEISELSGVPLYRVRSSFRELTAFGAMEEIDGLYQISDYGRELLAK
jgi:predicted transcriptional regulator